MHRVRAQLVFLDELALQLLHDGEHRGSHLDVIHPLIFWGAPGRFDSIAGAVPQLDLTCPMNALSGEGSPVLAVGLSLGALVLDMRAVEDDFHRVIPCLSEVSA